MYNVFRSNCMFPCKWRNNVFTLTTGHSTKGFWKFSDTTFIQKIGDSTAIFECFKIVGRFLIIR